MKGFEGKVSNKFLFMLLVLAAALISFNVFYAITEHQFKWLYIILVIFLIITLFILIALQHEPNNETIKEKIEETKTKEQIEKIETVEKVKPEKKKNKPKKKKQNNKELKKIQKKSPLYSSILKLNKKYKFEKFPAFVSEYEVSSKDIVLSANIDEYLLMTIKDKYETLKEYKINYDKQLNLYNEYQEKYDELNSIITEEEANKLKIDYETYKKYQNDILKKNKNKIDIVFVVDINIVVKGKNGKVVSRKNHKYYKDEFSILIQEFLKLRRENKLEEINIRVEKSKLSESLKNKVLKRDKFKCTVCGTTAKAKNKLNVEYIVPVEEGGRTDIDNLQTLCSKCSSKIK